MTIAAYYVYEHRRNDTGEVFYVGKGKGTRSINKHNRSIYWSRVCNKAGGFSVTYPVKEVDEELAFLAEVELIDAYRRRGVRIANITDGGEGASGWIPSAETRQRIGLANQSTPKARGENHGMYGKRHTEDARRKMSEIKSGSFSGSAHPFFGKHHSEETKAKISSNRKGKLLGENNPFFGKTHTAESLKKMRDASLGRLVSDAERSKRSELAMLALPKNKKAKSVFCITNKTPYFSLNDAARQLGLHRQAIRQVCNGKLKTTGQLIFSWGKK